MNGLAISPASNGSQTATSGAVAVEETRNAFQEDARLRVLHLIEGEGDLTQRQIAEQLGLSLGAVNYCLKGLIVKGAVKARNFRSSTSKWRYAYVLTPSGVSERAALTARYLARRLKEYEALKAEIESLGGNPVTQETDPGTPRS